jgi:predicted metal-dependent phosphoesterase TrpH
MIGLLAGAIIPLAQDDTLNQPVQDSARSQQIVKRSQRARPGRFDRALQIRPRRRHHQVAAVRQHQDQLEPAATAHPAHQRKGAALPRMTRPHDPHRRREAIEVGSVSCLPSIASTISG